MATASKAKKKTVRIASGLKRVRQDTKLNAAFHKTMADPEVRKQLVAAGYEVVGGEPEKLSSFIASETEKWKPVVKMTKLQVE